MSKAPKRPVPNDRDPVTRALYRKPSRKKLWISIMAALFVVIVLGGGRQAAGTPLTTDPDVRADAPEFAHRGPFPVGTRDVTIDGPTRLPATVWYPASGASTREGRITYPYQLKWFVRIGWPVRVAGAAIRNAPVDASRGARPVVVLSPGFSMGRTAYAWLAERWASHGFVVIAPEHRERMDASMHGFWQALVSRPADVRAVLDYIEREANGGGAFAGVMDTERVGVAGHSQGGYTALAMAGARLDLRALETRCQDDLAAGGANAWLCDMVLPYGVELAERAGLATPPEGLWPSWGDSRVRAVIAMASDAYLFGSEGLAEIDVPMLAMGGTADASAPAAWSSDLAYENVSSEVKARVALEGADHMIFAADCDAMPFFRRIGYAEFCSDPVWDSEDAHDVIAHFTTAFLLAELVDDADASAALDSANVDFAGVAYGSYGF